MKLKKVQERLYNPLPIEFQLTPYEMLMDDIRSKRFKLRQVTVSFPGGSIYKPSEDFISISTYSFVEHLHYICIYAFGHFIQRLNNATLSMHPMDSFLALSFEQQKYWVKMHVNVKLINNQDPKTFRNPFRTNSQISCRLFMTNYIKLYNRQWLQLNRL